MLWSGDKLRGYALHATDGAFGEVDDLLLDDESWAVRYVVVDTGHWLPGRQVLIAPHALGRPEAHLRTIPVSLSRRQIEDSPPIDRNLPVSRRMEDRLHQWYGWAPYFGGHAYDNPGGYAPGIIPPLEDSLSETEDASTHLRSMKALEGYRMMALDGDVGTVKDFEVDDEGWMVRYLVVDAGGWLSGKEALIPVHWVREIRWAENEVAVDVARQRIEEGPG